MSEPDPEMLRDHVLARLRCVHLRLRLLQAETDELGIFLKNGWITPEQAAHNLAAIERLPVYLASVLLQSTDDEEPDE